MTTATAFPPPLSAAPSVETLERLLIGLHRPMERGVPAPPVEVDVPERLFDGTPWDQRVPGVVRPSMPVERPALSWSARQHGTQHAVNAVVFAAAATAALAGLAAVGDLLP